MSDEKSMGQVIQIDEARIRDHLGEMVRGTVEETLNAMLDAEADQLCGAGRYERSEARQDTRAGSYERTLQTSAGDARQNDQFNPSTTIPTTPGTGSRPQLASILREGRESANIHFSSGVIRGIPAKAGRRRLEQWMGGPPCLAPSMS